MMLIIARSFTLGSQIALKTPSVDNFGIEAPIGTDAKTRQFATPQKLVNCGWMNAKIGRKLLHGHHPGKVVFGFCRHLFSSPRHFELLNNTHESGRYSNVQTDATLKLS